MTTFTKRFSYPETNAMDPETPPNLSNSTMETPLNLASRYGVSVAPGPAPPGHEASEIPEAVDETSAGMDLLTWTSLQYTGNFSAEYDTNFFSAYYDRRKIYGNGKGTGRGRPALIVLGYHMKSLKDLHLYCLYTYTTSSTESTVCFGEEAKQVKSCNSLLDGDKRATSFTYVCVLKCESVDCTDEEIPVFVALSSSPDCVATSGNIPVRNRQLPHMSDKKMFGVCLQSPVYGQIDLQQIVEFIEMNRVLGAEIITMYIMELKEDVLQFLLHHYSKRGLLQLVKWKKVQKWDPLHYFGQILTMHDCLYRNMRVKYLAVVDLDEVLLPLKHRSLLQLVESIGGQENYRYHSYRFGNCYYVSSSNANNASMPRPCKQVTLPKYFQRTNQVRCYCDDHHFSYRSKYIMQTEVIVDMGIHGICQATRGVEYKVPHSVAVNAHYRNPIPNDCTDKGSKYDPSALKYQPLVVEALGHQFCS